MPQTSKFHDDDDFLRQENSFLEHSALRIHDLKSSQARRHIKEGFIVRLLMMQSSRIFMREHTKSEGPLEIYLWTNFCIHLNAYYLNLRGALDNLAWALNYQFDLFPDITESSTGRFKCSLFHKSFLEQIATLSPSLSECLQSNIEWDKQLRDLRDPAAHRIPLTPVAGLIVGEDQLAEFRRLESLAARPLHELDGLPRSYYLQKAQGVAKYQPLFTLSSQNSHNHRHIPTQVASDHDTFLAIATEVFKCLWASAAV